MRNALVSFSLICILALASELRASSSLRFIAPTGTAPWILRDSKGEISGGMLFELAKFLEKISQRSIIIETSTYARIEQRLGKGDFDLALYTANQIIPRVNPLPFPTIVDDFGVIFLTKNEKMKNCQSIKTVAHTNLKSDALVQVLESQCGKKSIINTNGLNQRALMLEKERVDSFLGTSQEMDLLSWFGLPCGSVNFHKLFSIKVHILLHEDSILNKEPYREELIKFSKSFYPKTYDQNRKLVLGPKYCPEPYTKGMGTDTGRHEPAPRP